MKIGDAEFVAEGSEETVNRQYQQFLVALAARGNAPAQRRIDDPLPPPPGGGAGAGVIPQEILRQAFITDNEDVTLRALPQTDDSVTDSVILLLYGYRTVYQRLDVTAVALTEAVRASGIQTTRLDRIIGRSTLMRRAGAKRGTRYSLNNQGLARAEQLLREMYA